MKINELFSRTQVLNTFQPTGNAPWEHRFAGISTNTAPLLTVVRRPRVRQLSLGQATTWEDSADGLVAMCSLALIMIAFARVFW